MIQKMNSKVINEIKIKDGIVLTLVEGDITERNVDVIILQILTYSMAVELLVS